MPLQDAVESGRARPLDGARAGRGIRGQDGHRGDPGQGQTATLARAWSAT
jgi:hypothetical protein